MEKTHEELIAEITKSTQIAINETMEKALSNFKTELENKEKQIAEKQLELDRRTLPVGMEIKSPVITQPDISAKNLIGDYIGIVAKSRLFHKSFDQIIKEKQYQSGENSIHPHVVKSMTAGSFADGGATFDIPMSSEVIDVLVGKSIVRQAGARVRQMPSGGMKIKFNASSFTTSYVGETSGVNSSAMTFGQYQMGDRKIMTLGSISNDLLRRSPDIERTIQKDMSDQMSLKESNAFVEGTGTAYTPKGMKLWTNSSNILTSKGTSVTNIHADLINCIYTLDSSDLPPGAEYVWIGNPAVYAIMASKVDSNSNWMPYAREILNSNYTTLYGKKMFSSTGIAKLILYLVDINQALIGDTLNLQIEFFKDGTYLDSTSTLQSGISRDESVFRAILESDFMMCYDKAVTYVPNSWALS